MSVAARLKLFLGGYGSIVAIVLLIAAAGMFGLAYQVYHDTPTETVTEEVDIENYAVTAHTEAVVDAQDPVLYEPGEELVGMPAYFYNESPRLTIVANVSTPPGESVDVDARMTIVYRAERDEHVFWEHRDLLAEESTTVRDGEMTITATKDMRSALQTVESVESRAGAVGSVDTFIELHVEYESQLYEGSFSPETEVQLGSQAYWLSEDLEDSSTESQLETHTIELDPPMEQVIGFGILGIMLLMGSLGILLTLYRGVDTERLRTELARGEYAEWISRGEIPTSSEKQFVSIDSLEDLVDVAIDSNRRVLYDTEIDTYGVVEGDLVYYYSPTRDDIDEWLDL